VDLKNYMSLKKIKIDPDYIVNLSGYVDHTNKKKTYQSHYIGCKNLALISLKKNIKNFIQIGSSMEYGKKKSPQKENMNCNPLSVYGKSKLLASKYLLGLHKKENFPVTILRLYQVYGPYQDQNRFIPIIINSCKKKINFPCSNGKQYRDFLYIDDLVDAIFACFKKTSAIGKIINIGNGKPIKIKKIINKIVKLYKSGKPFFGKIKIRKEEMQVTYPNIENSKKLLKWKPKISFTKGLNNTIRYYNAINK
jgi:nucleoside-diphosphate-sugar epimerase